MTATSNSAIRRVSVSEITAWKDCRTKWSYRYETAIAKPQNGAMLASGSAVHGTIESVLRGDTPAKHSAAKAEELLRAHFEGHHDLQRNVDRYLPGVLRALSRFPSWVWEEDWAVETPIDHNFGDVEIWGIPDVVRVGADDIVIGEFKSTSNSSKTPQDYLLFNPQHRYYAVLLREKYNLPIYVRYAIAQTGRYGGVNEAEWLMKERVLDTTKDEMLAAAREIGTLPIVPNYGVGCNYCDYKELCANTITGGGTPDYLISQLYVPKELTRE